MLEIEIWALEVSVFLILAPFLVVEWPDSLSRSVRTALRIS